MSVLTERENDDIGSNPGFYSMKGPIVRTPGKTWTAGSIYEAVRYALASENWWMECSGATSADIDIFATEFDLHPFTVKAMISKPDTAMFQEYHDYIYVSYPTMASTYMFLVFPGRGLVTIQRGGEPLLRSRRCSTLEPFKVFQTLLNVLTNSLHARVDGLSKLVSTLRAELAPSEEGYSKLADARASAVTMMTEVRSKIMVVDLLSRRDVANWEVISNRLASLLQQLESDEGLLTRVHYSWTSTATIGSEDLKRRTLLIICQFSVVVLILMPTLGVVTFGHMNMPIPYVGHVVDGNKVSLGWWGGVIGVVCGLLLLILAVAYLLTKRIINRPPPPLIPESGKVSLYK